ncbi:MAG: hypothetical protein RBS77_06150 [Candidatus Moranbacteria bacterium]|nr:hypothetical protein [Candidatus Moranbacteria bacterium]
MESKRIDNKHLDDYELELFKLIDDLNQPIGYSVRKTYISINNIFGSGAARIEEINFSNREEAIIFFNNQN